MGDKGIKESKKTSEVNLKNRPISPFKTVRKQRRSFAANDKLVNKIKIEKITIKGGNLS